MKEKMIKHTRKTLPVPVPIPIYSRHEKIVRS
jgi:hypothetical protein